MKIFLPLYALTLLFLAPSLSLWLDEILTLVGAVQPNTSALLDYIKTVPGGSPLAFLAPRWSIQLLGNSIFAARLPSVLASIAACPAIYLLAQRMKMRTPLLAVIVFALWPLQLRYALEARPYALALALSVWSTEIFLSLGERPSRAWLYVTLTVLAALTQPYALFITAAHLAWALLCERKFLRAPLAAITLTTIVLIPWYAHFRADWTPVNAAQQLTVFDPKSALVFLREISGSGYAGAAILLAGIALTWKRAQSFWLLNISIPVIAVFAANAALHYFFATRQLIFVVPALALLFTLGGDRLLLIAFLAASLYEDFNWFRKPRENWQAAADVIEREVSTGACVTFLADTTPVYLFFHPQLAQHVCTSPQDRVVIATSPYIPSTNYAPLGLTLKSEQSFNGPRIEVFAK
jgi:uncharacterized membrane protein